MFWYGRTSDDGQHVASVRRLDDGGKMVVTDGTDGPRFDECTEPRFRPGASAPTYLGRQGGRWALVVDGQERPDALPAGAQPDEPYWVSDRTGARLAIHVIVAGKHHILVAGELGPAYDDIETLLVAPGAFRAGSPDSPFAGIAYVARRGASAMAVIDGQEGEEFAEVSMGCGAMPEFAALSWMGGPGENPVEPLDPLPGPRGGEVILGGEERKDLVGALFAVNPATGRAAWVDESRDDRLVIHQDGVPDTTVAGGFMALLDPPRFSPDGQRLWCVGYDGHDVRLIVDGAAGPAYRVIRDVTFSPDGAHVAYVAQTRVPAEYEPLERGGPVGALRPPRRAGAAEPGLSPLGPPGEGLAEDDLALTVAVVDGVAGPPFQTISHLGFGESDESILYAGVCSGKLFLALRNGTYVPIGADSVMAVSPDRTRAVYRRQQAGRDEGWFEAIVDRDRIGAFRQPEGMQGLGELNQFSVLFSPDSKHVAVSGITPDGLRVYVDGSPGPAFSAVISMRFAEDGSLEYLALGEPRGNEYEISRVRHVPVGD